MFIALAQNSPEYHQRSSLGESRSELVFHHSSGKHMQYHHYMQVEHATDLSNQVLKDYVLSTMSPKITLKEANFWWCWKIINKPQDSVVQKPMSTKPGSIFVATASIDGSHYVVGNVSEFVTICLNFMRLWWFGDW